MIKINISIESDSVEEAKQALWNLGSGTTVNLLPVGGEELKTPTPTPAPTPAPAEKPKATRTKAAAAEPAKPEATVVPLNADPLAANGPVTDPLANAPVNTPTADPLAGNVAAAPVTDPLAATAPTPTAPAATAQSGEVTLQTIREKIGAFGGDKKQQCKDLIATYKKADGSPCEKPSDIQEKDYVTVYDDLDYV